MKRIFVILTVFLLAGPVLAQDLSSHPPLKNSAHCGNTPGTPDGREGGETIETAVPILSIPFNDTGNTSDNLNDYDEECPYDAVSKDVVYSFVPDNDLFLTVDLCGSGFDTKTYIYDQNLEVVACNDDFYSDPECGVYVSKIEDAPLLAGQTYFIVIDAYGGDSGDYILLVEEGFISHPCIMECSGEPEGEPTLQDGYVDIYNTGCNDDSGLMPFQTLAGDESEYLFFCGKSGWYSPDGSSNFRDTDWFLATIGSTGILNWVLDSEQPVFGFLLGPQDCSTVAVVETIETYCTTVSMTIQGDPGEVVWLWVGPQDYSAPPGFVGHEFNYISLFYGLAYSGSVATNATTFEGLKCLYR